MKIALIIITSITRQKVRQQQSNNLIIYEDE